MALKDLKTKFDLVGGENPVGNMANQIGPLFDLGPDSVLQQNSLPQIPNQSPFQDLNGEPGPQFNNGPELSGYSIDTIHEESLMDGSTNLSLNGNQGPQFNQGPEPNIPNTIDTLHEESLIDQSTDLGLGGEQGPSFDFGPEYRRGLNFSFLTLDLPLFISSK